MANVPVDYISLQKAYSVFCEQYDVDGISTEPEPICPGEDAFENERWLAWRAALEKLGNDSTNLLRLAFFNDELTALYEVDGKSHYYHVEAHLWDEKNFLERAFYDDFFPVAANPYCAVEHLADEVAPFVHKASFDKWMEWRFPKPAIETYHQHHDLGQRINLEQTVACLSATVPDEAWELDYCFHPHFGFLPSEASANRLSVNAVCEKSGRSVTISAGEWGHLLINPLTGNAEKKGIAAYSDLLFHRKQVEALLPVFEKSFAAYWIDSGDWSRWSLSDPTKQWLVEKAKSQPASPKPVRIDDDIPAYHSGIQFPAIHNPHINEASVVHTVNSNAAISADAAPDATDASRLVDKADISVSEKPRKPGVSKGSFINPKYKRIEDVALPLLESGEAVSMKDAVDQAIVLTGYKGDAKAAYDALRKRDRWKSFRRSGTLPIEEKRGRNGKE